MGLVFCVGTQLAVTELLKYKSLLQFAAGIRCNMLIVKDMTAYSLSRPEKKFTTKR
jgi:hypothetical protein